MGECYVNIRTINIDLIFNFANIWFNEHRWFRKIFHETNRKIAVIFIKVLILSLIYYSQFLIPSFQIYFCL